jgi:hypothetical protein
VTLTTVGYGDIVPKTSGGRFAGMAIMFTGIAVLGVLAGSLSALFRLDESSEPAKKPGGAAGEPDGVQPVHAELNTLRAQLHAIDVRLEELAERTRPDSGEFM